MSETVKEKAIRLWVAGLSSGQIAAETGASRNAVVGYIFRAGKKLLAETGVNPYARPDQSHNTRNGLRYPEGYVPRAPKPPRRLKVVSDKPPRIKREKPAEDFAPGERLPPLERLSQSLWTSLPGCEPKSLIDLPSRGCKWPIHTLDNPVDGGASTMFCAAVRCDDSPYCRTHRSWSRSKKPAAPLNLGKAA